MILHYSQTGAARKDFVKAISEVFQTHIFYRGTPTFAYAVGSYIIDKGGNLCCGDDISSEEIRQLVLQLQNYGYTAPDAEDLLAESIAANMDKANKLVISVPRIGFTWQAIENLQKIVDSKTTLLKLALGTDSLEITTDGCNIYFPWFTLHDIEGEADAYSRLISAICDMAKRQSRVIATEKPIENAKFSMRLFLIRLGFIGDKYKTARKILLRNLTGNSSWKHGVPPERFSRQTRPQTAVIPPSPAQAMIIANYNHLPLSSLTANMIEAADTELEAVRSEKAGAVYGK